MFRNLIEQREFEKHIEKQKIDEKMREKFEEGLIEKQKTEEKLRQVFDQKLKMAAQDEEVRKAFSRQGFFEELLAQSKRAKLAAADVVLREGDVVTVTVVSGSDRLTASRRTIGADGLLTLPIVGTTKVAGLTVAQAGELLKRAFISHKFGDDPAVTVSGIWIRR